MVFITPLDRVPPKKHPASEAGWEHQMKWITGCSTGSRSSGPARSWAGCTPKGPLLRQPSGTGPSAPPTSSRTPAAAFSCGWSFGTRTPGTWSCRTRRQSAAPASAAYRGVPPHSSAGPSCRSIPSSSPMSPSAGCTRPPAATSSRGSTRTVWGWTTSRASL